MTLRLTVITLPLQCSYQFDNVSPLAGPPAPIGEAKVENDVSRRGPGSKVVEHRGHPAEVARSPGLKFAGYAAREGDYEGAEIINEWACQMQWAQEALARENCTFDNGTNLHDNARRVYCEASDKLLPYMTFTVHQ